LLAAPVEEGRPSRVPWATARLSPALIRCRIIDRSNSAKAPVTWNTSFPIDADRLKVLDRAKQVNERASEPINCPCHHNIEIPATCTFQHPIETGTLSTTFGSADACIGVNLDHFLAASHCYLLEFPYLVLDRLGVGAYPRIDRCTVGSLGHASIRPMRMMSYPIFHTIINWFLYVSFDVRGRSHFRRF
jgi:hypothetical protein